MLAAEPQYPTWDLDPETVEAVKAAAFECQTPEHRNLFREMLFAVDVALGEQSYIRRHQMTLGGVS